MPADQTATSETETETEGETEAKEQETAEAKKLVPISALQAERTARQELAAELEKMKEAQVARERAAAEEAGKHKELYEALKPELAAAKEQIAAYEMREATRVEALAARNAARIEALPEAYRSLVPEGLDEDDRSLQIERIEAIVTADEHRPAGTLGSGGGSAQIPDACKQQAADNRRDPKWWFEHVWSTAAAKKRREAKT